MHHVLRHRHRERVLARCGADAVRAPLTSASLGTRAHLHTTVPLSPPTVPLLLQLLRVRRLRLPMPAAAARCSSRHARRLCRLASRFRSFSI